ncbi:NVEALA domain-containing protein [uncultured Alistipes sp.]|uniref:NVEALA domain-containing protein n=1 Tax=uncultured Alistipes sp. TaxID=538949 RepID=UPI00338E1C2D
MIVIITTVTTVYSLKKIHPMSELLCANIEALSTGEDDGYIRNEHGCIIWPAITCFGIVITPEGSFAADFPDSRN